MSDLIHKTAIIHPSAILAEEVRIGPFTIIGPNVVIGFDTYIGAHCVIGGPPEHKDHWHTEGKGVNIGMKCFISNGVTIDSGIEHETYVHSYSTMLAKSHAGHDSVVSLHSTISCLAIVGGHSKVMPYANCGLASVIHQNCIVGPGAMLGAGTIVTKKTPIEPFKVYVGNPARYLKMNDIGIERAGIGDEQLKFLQGSYDEAIKR